MKYTPGPWRARGASVRPAKGQGATGGYKPLASAQHDKRLPDNREANARLIAAAPELLEALQWALHQMPEPVLKGEYTDKWMSAKIAVRKALEGE